MIFVLLESQLPKVFVLDGEGLRGFHNKPLYFSDAAYQLLPDAAFNGDYFHLQFHFLLISGAKVRQWKNFDWQVVNKLSITFFYFVPKTPTSSVFRCQLMDANGDSAAIRLPLQPFRIKVLKSMDIVVLEKSAFEQLLSEVRQLTQRVEMLSRKCQDKRFQKWLTGEDVCEILEISQRSLQTMRSKHKICYAQLGRKFYYRPEEVELVVKQSGKYHHI